MNLHLYHAIKYASLGAEQMSGAAWASALCDGTSVENGYIATAREYLARATAELNAYDAKRQEIKPANAAAEITRLKADNLAMHQRLARWTDNA